MSEWPGQIWRVMKASGTVGRALRLERQGRLVESRSALEEALDRIGPAGDGFFYPHRLSIRLLALTALARVAAALDDRELA